MTVEELKDLVYKGKYACVLKLLGKVPTPDEDYIRLLGRIKIHWQKDPLLGDWARSESIYQQRIEVFIVHFQQLISPVIKEEKCEKPFPILVWLLILGVFVSSIGIWYNLPKEQKQKAHKETKEQPKPKTKPDTLPQEEKEKPLPVENEPVKGEKPMYDNDKRISEKKPKIDTTTQEIGSNKNFIVKVRTVKRFEKGLKGLGSFSCSLELPNKPLHTITTDTDGYDNLTIEHTETSIVGVLHYIDVNNNRKSKKITFINNQTSTIIIEL